MKKNNNNKKYISIFQIHLYFTIEARLQHYKYC